MDHPINIKKNIFPSPDTNQPCHELTQHGFDINSPNEDGLTPLHQAVLDNDIETISKLLYDGADVNLVDRRNFNPFVQAVIIFNLPAVSILSNYHQQFRPKFTYAYYKDILDLKFTKDELIIHNKKFLSFMVSLWKKLDQSLGEINIDCFLRNYLKECDSTKNFPLIANCFFILQFTLPFYLGKNSVKCNFSELFTICEDRLIVQSDRMGLTWNWLSLGIEVFLNDVKTAFRFYGYDEEVEALISTTKSPVLTFILALEENDNEMVFKKYLSRGFESPIFKLNTMHKNTVQIIHKLLHFFALPWRMKEELLRKCRRFEVDDVQIMRKLVQLPEVPLLREISRNCIMKYIKKKCEIKKVEEYEKVVNKLDVPNVVKDVILFRRPLYI